MSSDDDFMDDSDEDDFDSGDTCESSDGELDSENAYYTAKQYKDDDPDQALAGFFKVVEEESPKGEWGFRSLKQIMKVNLRLGNHDGVIDAYKTLLTYIESAVPKNYSEKSISNLMEKITTGPLELAETFFGLTRDALQSGDARSDRLWFKANVKLGNIYLTHGRLSQLAEIIKDLEAKCKNADGTDDLKKANQLFEIFSLKFPMLDAQKSNKELKIEYTRAMRIESAIPAPGIMGTIQEYGGKMYLAEQSWEKSYECFFEAFKNYDEAGDPRRISCLKMLVISNMLSESDIDPFGAQESQQYKTHSDIQAMTDLVGAYQANDIKQFEKILKRNRTTLLEDPLIHPYISNLRTNIRSECIVQLIKPYTRVRISFMEKKLDIKEPGEVEHLLKMCILDGRISGHIDQVEQLLVVKGLDSGDNRYEAIDKWSAQIQNLMKSVASQLSS